MKKIRVLHVIGSLHIGGAETVVVDYLKYIDKEKFQFDYLVYSDSRGENEEIVEKFGGRVIHMDGPSKNRIFFKQRLKRVMIENGPYDIVHAHLLLHNAIILDVASKCDIQCRISHSHSTHNIPEKNIFQRYIQKIYYRVSKNIICKKATHFVACSEEAGCYLYGKRIFEQKGIVLHNGIDCEKFKYNEDTRQSIRKALDIEEKYVYGNAAHFYPVKNHEFLINIFKEVSLIQDDAYLILMGEGYLRSEIEKKVREMGLQDKVLFTGNVTNIEEYMQGLDMFIMPSHFEGFGMALLEAQNSGLRCVVSDTIPKLVDIKGGLIEFVSLNKSAKEWAQIIIRKVHYERFDTTRLIEAKNFSIRKTVKKLEDLYLSL